MIAESNLHYQDESTETMTLRLKGQTKPAYSASAQKLTLKFTYLKETVEQALALQQKTPTCLNFFLSLRVQQVEDELDFVDPTLNRRENELLRVDWHGYGSTSQKLVEKGSHQRYYDPRYQMHSTL